MDRHPLLGPDGVRDDGALAVANFAQGVGVLPLGTRWLLTLFGEPGVIDTVRPQALLVLPSCRLQPRKMSRARMRPLWPPCRRRHGAPWPAGGRWLRPTLALRRPATMVVQVRGPGAPEGIVGQSTARRREAAGVRAWSCGGPQVHDEVDEALGTTFSSPSAPSRGEDAGHGGAGRHIALASHARTHLILGQSIGCVLPD